MIRSLITIFIASYSLFSNASEKNLHALQSSSPKLAKTYNVNVLINKKDHLFSNTTYPDHFIITLNGKNIRYATVVFKITNYKNKELFKLRFIGADLLYDQGDVLNLNQQKDTITHRIAHFFDQNKFTVPAIARNARFDPDEADITTWKDVKADPGSTRFTFNYGYETTYGIAFDKRKNKTVYILTVD